MHHRLAERLRTARRAIGESRIGLATLAGAGKTAVQNIEYAGQIPGVDLIEEIARVLGVSPGWLAYGMGEPGEVMEVPGCGQLGERVRTTREEAGLSLRALARRSGCSDMTLGNVQRGTMPSVATLEQIADALNVSPAWLAYGEGPERVKRRRARQ